MVEVKVNIDIYELEEMRKWCLEAFGYMPKCTIGIIWEDPTMLVLPNGSVSWTAIYPVTFELKDAEVSLFNLMWR